jgi:hypothetical protein
VELLSDDDSDQLCEKDKVLFHALVAKLLYLVKRSRPDGLLVISKLSTRVGCPNITDMKKLKKLCGYFKSTADFGTVLKWELQGDVNFFVDASYACDTDCRSRTGVVMSIGGVALSCWTNKQSLVARSSTEAEIIGLAEGLTHVLWARNMLSDLGIGLKPMIIYQDNES